MRIKISFPALLPALMLCGLPLTAADWPVYRGPQHDGTSAEKLPAKSWSATGPKQIWRTPLTDGFSSFSVADGKAFTLVKRSQEGVGREMCVAIDARTGKELWATQVGMAKYDGGGDAGTADNKGGDGPRSTPTFDGNRVYVLSADLNLACLDAATGKAVWTKDLAKENGARNISWKNAASPVIEGDLLYVCGGGESQALLGLNKKDGNIVWKGESDKMTHATPTLATIHGVRQVIFFPNPGSSQQKQSLEKSSGDIPSDSTFPPQHRPWSREIWFIARPAMESARDSPK